jgi:hypothetical protein
MDSGGGKLVEHSAHHPKVEGSNLVLGIVLGKMANGRLKAYDKY